MFIRVDKEIRDERGRLLIINEKRSNEGQHVLFVHLSIEAFSRKIKIKNPMLRPRWVNISQASIKVDPVSRQLFINKKKIKKKKKKKKTL